MITIAAATLEVVSSQTEDVLSSTNSGPSFELYDFLFLCFFRLKDRNIIY